MSEHAPKVIVSKQHDGASLHSYVTGYIASISLTLLAYLLVVHTHFSRDRLIAAIAGLALLQAIVQLIFFLHMGRETKPRWKLMVFSFMVVLVIIIVAGSLWIMNNLNYRMTPEQMNQYLQSQDNL